MKPINLLNYLTAICLLFIGISFQGCINDDLSECGINVRFTYTQNIDGTDKFAESVDNIDLYIFDSKGIFLSKYEEEYIASNGINLNLMPGTYSFVAWGNLSDDYDIPTLIPNETSIDDVILSLKRENDEITEHPTHLFHGALLSAVVLPDIQQNQTLTIDMIKDTKSIKVTSVGLPMETKASQDFTCFITSRNGDYKFDNSITGDTRLKYIPNETVNDSYNLISDFVTMRELNDDSTESRLIIRYNDDTEEKEVFNESLVGMLLPASVTGNLDLEDTFDILLTFNAGRVFITVNGWNLGSIGGIL